MSGEAPSNSREGKRFSTNGNQPHHRGQLLSIFGEARSNCSLQAGLRITFFAESGLGLRRGSWDDGVSRILALGEPMNQKCRYTLPLFN